jgi:large subunit ribosomal protein L23
MKKRSPYNVIKNRYVTEKSRVLESLYKVESNASVKRCNSPKYVFLVDKDSTKQEIALAVEKIYEKDRISVARVNTITIHPKQRTVRGRRGMKSGFKKAVVTLRPGDFIEEIV